MQVVSAVSSRGSTPSPTLLTQHPQRRLTHRSLFAPLPSAFTLQPLSFSVSGLLATSALSPQTGQLALRPPPRDISVPWGPFLGCVRLSLQILPSHDLWWHLCACVLNFNGCRAQAHVKLNFISISSAGPSLGPALEGAETSRAEKRTGCIPQSRLPASASNVQARSCLSPPPPPLLLSLCLHLSRCLGPPLLLPQLYPLSPNEQLLCVCCHSLEMWVSSGNVSSCLLRTYFECVLTISC